MHPDASRHLLPALRVLNAMFNEGATILAFAASLNVGTGPKTNASVVGCSAS